MFRVILVVPDNRVGELWLENEDCAYFLARRGAHGLDRMGWHNHQGQITGDWCDTEDVLAAYHISDINN